MAPVEADVLLGGRRRRVPGLRREEVATLAGVSPDYLARMEQGRARRPTAGVLAALAKALRLSAEERAHLHRLAGIVEPRSAGVDRHITPSLRRLLERVSDVPVVVEDVAQGVLARNAAAVAVIGEVPSSFGHRGSLAWRHFSGQRPRSLLTAVEHRDAGARIVADLREARGRFPADDPLAVLIEELHERSPRFARLWREHRAPLLQPHSKRFYGPDGRIITLDRDELTVAGSELSVVVYTAPAGSRDAEALTRLIATRA